MEGEELMTPSEREEAVALAINNMDWSQLDHGIAPSNEEIARAAIAVMDIEKIEREAYERGMNTVCLLVEQWYDNHCNNVSQEDLMVALGRLLEKEMHR